MAYIFMGGLHELGKQLCIRGCNIENVDVWSGGPEARKDA
jgi:hypothetical protein